MTADSDPTLSLKTLADLFAGALHVGVRTPPPEAPDWFGATDFPLVIEGYVGRGGSGFVWKASRRDGHGAVALKLVPFRGDPLRLRERWENECAALSRLDHPNLIHLVDHGLAPDGDSGWLAMEWIAGRSLDALLSEQERLPFSETQHFLLQIGDALSALHAAGLVHRDVKPGNILRDEVNARWVLADLGIALDLEKIADHRVTRTQERPATPGYSPPELDLPGHTSAPSGDQYSLAFTLWEMLTGQRPLGAFPRLHTLCKCPEGIDAVLRRALATAPVDRFPDIAAFTAAFQKAATRPPRSFLFLGLLGMLCIVAAIYFTTRPEPFPKQFKSGRVHARDNTQQFTTIDLTLQESGHFIAHIRTTSLDPLFGFVGRTMMIFRDVKGEILYEMSTNHHGVGGRYMFGLTHDRVDQWENRIPANLAPRVVKVDFRNMPSTWTLEERAKDNNRAFRRDVASIRDGVARGWSALNQMFSLASPSPEKKDEDPEMPATPHQ